MRSRWTALAASLLLLAATGARAQRPLRRIPSPAPPPRAVRSAPAPAATGEAAVGTRHRFLNMVLYGAGGAVLGAWGGYMTSQIVWSDWQELGRPGFNRMRYTLVGAGIGALAGAVLGHHVKPAVLPPGRRTPWGILPTITPEEIRASGARSAGELIRTLRPGWLTPRGTDTFGGAIVQTYTTEGVAIYVDGNALGNVADLEALPLAQVTGVEYYDVKAATERWGAGHLHTAINVITTRAQS